MTNDEKVFKRINFFKGFVTTEEDWNDAERYHVEKHKLHNRAFHGVGVVRGWGQEFQIAARGKGELSVEVFPGYSIDGQGNDIILWKPQILPINKGDYKLPQTIYLVIKFVEEHTDFIAYKQNLDFQGHRRIAERCKLEWTEKEPDWATEIELCRVQLTREATALEQPKDPADPGVNQIDRRFVPYAGVAGGTLDARLLWELRRLIEEARIAFARLWRDQQVASANNVFQALITTNMLLEAGQLGPSQVMSIMALIADLQADVVGEIEASKPNLSAKNEFKLFKNNVELLRDVTDEGQKAIASGLAIPSSKLGDVANFQAKSASAISKVVQSVAPVRAAVQISGDVAPAAPEGISRIILDNDPGWEQVKVRSDPFTETINVNGVTWTMVDEINVLDRESEEKHGFTIRDARDQYRMRQRLRYPDGVTVLDTGIAHEGGHAEWEILNVTPNVDLVIIRRMDYVRADYECEVYCEGDLVGIIPCPGDDRRFRWRNWPFQIPARMITRDRLRIRQKMLTADRDINFFHLWFYQPL
jgi:hypothetical protein